MHEIQVVHFHSTYSLLRKHFGVRVKCPKTKEGFPPILFTHGLFVSVVLKEAVIYCEVILPRHILES